MEKLEYNEMWWLPDQKDKTVSGGLKFDPKDGTFLDLIGSFRDFNDFQIH